VTRALKRVEFLQALIDDLLDLAAAKTGLRISTEAAVVDLRRILDEVIERYRIPAEEKGLTLEAHIESSEPLYLRANPAELDRAFTNLVSNAVKSRVQRGEVHPRGRKGHRDAGTAGTRRLYHSQGYRDWYTTGGVASPVRGVLSSPQRQSPGQAGHVEPPTPKPRSSRAQDWAWSSPRISSPAIGGRSGSRAPRESARRLWWSCPSWTIVIRGRHHHP